MNILVLYVDLAFVDQKLNHVHVLLVDGDEDRRAAFDIRQFEVRFRLPFK